MQDNAMADWQEQYRTVTTAETTALDSMSVRVVRHMELAINSTIVALSPKLVSDASPSTTSADSSASERVQRVYGPFVVAPHLDTITATLGHYRSVGADSVVWKLYCCGQLYNDVATLVSASLGSLSDVATIATTSSDTHAVTASVRGLDVIRGADGMTWFTLTATNGDTSTRARMTTLDITAQDSAVYA